MQVFKRSSNTTAKLSVGLVFGSLILAFGITEVWTRSSYSTNLNVDVIQPVAFSHKHHVKGLGLDCRYCHGSVENSAFAGMPATHTCMNCHSHIWSKSDELKPVRDSESQNIPLQWNRVYQLPDFVYFNHSIHIKKGVSCVICHGHIEEMPFVHKTKAFYMRQCLECHRHPGDYIRPQNEIFNFWWQNQNSKISPNELIQKYHINSHTITNCTTCHR